MSIPNNAGTSREVPADKAWSVERHAIEPIPAADRHGAPIELFGLWAGANINYVVLLTGALAVTQGLSFWGAVAAIVVGNVFGCLVVGLASIMGPKTGTAGIIASRPSFGQLGAVLPIVISTISALGWFSINSVVATQSLAQVFAQIGLPASSGLSWVAMLIVLACEILIAIYGHATIIAAEKYVSLGLAALFAGLLIIALPQIPAIDFGWTVAPSAQPGKGGFATWLLVVGLIFSYPLSWTNFASDYSRYLPADTPWRAIARAAGGGQFAALTFCEIVGVVFAIAVGGEASTDPVADLPKVLPAWYVTPFLLAVIVGSIATNVPNGYTAGLGLLALRLPLRRVTSILAIAGATLAFRVVTLLYGQFFDLYQQWLGYILIWTSPWVAIVILDYFLRHGRYDPVDLMCWRGRYWYRGGVFWPGMIAFLAGLGAFFLFSNSEMFSSPLMTRYLAGTDLSFEAGMAAAALVYYALARRRVAPGG